jgi:protein phosphatase
MRITIPELSVIALVGVSGSGKSTFAARHFLPTEVISSDFCRKLVSDDENDQSATAAAFAVLHTIAAQRLASGRIVVIDATSVRPDDRKPIVQLARDHHVFAYAIVLDVPPEVCRGRNATRPERDFGDHVIRNQRSALRRSINNLHREGFRKVYVLRGVDDIDHAEVIREQLWTDKRILTGPFDIIGDVHGCHTELVELLELLGWQIDATSDNTVHPEGRQAIFLGDLVDRGPASPAVLRLAMNMVRSGAALCIPGNHENKLKRALDGKNVTLSHGLVETMEQLAAESAEFRAEVASFIDGLVSHAVLDGGSLVVAHAGLPEAMHGRSSGAVRSFALYGDTTGETDEFGLPVRYPWAKDYRGRAAVVYGHTPVPDAVWINGTICIDTGCVFGGSLSALRWPERELVSVPAHETYYEPTRPLQPVVAERPSDVLDLDDVIGKRIIEARLTGTVTIREENAAAAIEVMSRFAIDPHWLVYLPPTMSPPATTTRAGLLEHPSEAFDAYRRAGVTRLVCEEKHMGSRAVVVVCRDEAAALRRFGVVDPNPAAGAIFTRTGRAFFKDRSLESAMLDNVRAAITALDMWSELESDWLVFDCELLPWSAKAEELLRTQYASVGAAATTTLRAERDVWAAVAARIEEAAPLAARVVDRLTMASRFVDAYRRYCWPTTGLEGLRLAPFQVLASEGRVRALDPHPWHIAIADRLAEAAPDTFRATRNIEVDLDDASSEATAIAWWEELTSAGGEGMVIKPIDVVAQWKRGVVQPGVKCRGPEYLRIIYGAEYTSPEQLSRLRERSLGHKRGLAVREFCLGIEALERFVRNEPLYRVHECVFGVLALESEPVDPRL